MIVPIAQNEFVWFAEILNWKITINLLIVFALLVISFAGLMMLIVTGKPPKEILRKREN